MPVEFNLAPYSVDFANQFDLRTEGFLQFFNLMSVGQGTLIKGKTANVDLAEDMTHAKGAEISESDIQLDEIDIAELIFEATKVRVSYQDIQKFGRATAIDRKDNELIDALAEHIEDTLITNMSEFAEGAVTAETYKRGLAKAAGEVKSVRGFKGAKVVAFVNTLDYYDHLADSEVATAQSLFGMEYVEDFLGYDAIFMSNKIAEGEFLVTARNNLNLAHIPANGEAFNSLGLTPTENNLLGVKHYLDDDTGDILTKAHFGLEAFGERVDAVIKVTIGVETAGE
jgi:hypothetical protein